MTPSIPSCTRLRDRPIVRLLCALSLSSVVSIASIDPISSLATEIDQSRIVPPAGDGWQALSAANAGQGDATKASSSGLNPSLTSTATQAAAAPGAMQTASLGPSMKVALVVLPAATVGGAPAGQLSLVITPQDVNLRNALDRWLQRQGWQLAWKIDDDLPLEFNATFTGNFNAVLTRVMQATNHMRTPTRVCEHTNNVIRVVARAANCQE